VQKAIALVLTSFLAASAVACSSARKPHEVSPALEAIVSGNPLPKVEPEVW
jgi:hypothetical protein